MYMFCLFILTIASTGGLLRVQVLVLLGLVLFARLINPAVNLLSDDWSLTTYFVRWSAGATTTLLVIGQCACAATIRKLLNVWRVP
jgi:hypothetical protein